ncbi:helix-turn-helix transcriptional regulator [Spirillospora sp. NPDC029432]|uniref:helix-turn-helix transcriptional regulator n=1 Tax=Spirillospora sp. NPDC029432 TaxID=3154599 RepID=UPI00345728DE
MARAYEEPGAVAVHPDPPAAETDPDPDLELGAEVLRRVFPADVIVWLERKPPAAGLGLLVWSPDEPVPHRRSAPTGAAGGPPVFDDVRARGPYRITSPPGARTMDDPLSAPYQLFLARDEDSAWLLARPDRDFASREVQMAAILLPGMRRAGRPASAPQVRLTSRETGILRLVADGLTAAAIARRLGISVRTVHKHLEHAYAKLSCGDRLSAVMKAGDLGLL